MERISRAFLIGTSLAYLAVLFYTYAYFAELSSVKIKVLDNQIQFSNNTLFYSGLIIPTVIVLICVALAVVINSQPIGSNFYFKQEKARNTLASWARSLAGAFNLFFASLLTVFIFVNNEDGLTQTGYLPLLIGSLLLIFFWVLWLPFILRRNK
ncbi:hypothetical protein [Marivirga harenae]|uniref:hypothetical protein n=1 Tax=Marivirga harenae TaxID=2010992 RepID=UPI0026DFF1E9|nr:hypothetical protein [Marivirga harenae]WKV11543.1 hypothetical protein Q3Y49_15170 [Marivirga harenae]|tara:strand:- start:28914 stop:29375 length:462 start_codon:yes stop_codon:yes gene_type:complete